MRKIIPVIPIEHKITEIRTQKLYSVLQSLMPLQGKEKTDIRKALITYSKYMLLSDLC